MNGYKDDGPYYCPNGTTWDELAARVKELRAAGNSVIVQKIPDKTIWSNTHRVFLQVKAK